MAQAQAPAPLRQRRASVIVGVALVMGLAAGAGSYLSTSLSIPGPARAGNDELRQRGAAVYMEFCSWPKFEPRFGPECVGSPDDWQARGAERLVTFCTAHVPSRMFDAPDCLSNEQPMRFALAGAPQPQDVAIGGGAAALAAAVLLLSSASSAALVPRRRGS